MYMQVKGALQAEYGGDTSLRCSLQGFRIAFPFYPHIFFPPYFLASLLLHTSDVEGRNEIPLWQ